MQKRMMLLIIVVLILCTLTGCAGQNAPQPTQPPAATNQSEPVENTTEPAEQSALYDPRGSIPFNRTSTWIGNFVETSFADYYVKFAYDGTPYTIMVKPKGYDQFVPLCGKPNCAHDSESCNAAVQWDTLGYCNNRLYFVAAMGFNSEGLLSIGSMLPDGTDRRKEMTVPPPEKFALMDSHDFFHYFHGNKLLIQYFPPSGMPLEFQEHHMLVVDLETKEVTEPFKEFLQPGITTSVCQLVGPAAYCEASFRDADGHEECWQISLNLETGEVRKLFPYDQSWGIEYAEDQIFYSYVTDGERTLAVYDLATGETEYRTIQTPEGSLICRYSGDFVLTTLNASDPQDYDTCDYTAYFLNRDFELLGKIRLGENISYMFEAEDAYYFGPVNREIATFRLEKSKIGTGELELVPV